MGYTHTEYLAHRLRGFKDRANRVNVVSFGSIHTSGLEELAGADPAQQRSLNDYLASRIPLGCPVKADEIAKAALSLEFEEASLVIGVEFFVGSGQAF